MKRISMFLITILALSLVFTQMAPAFGSTTALKVPVIKSVVSGEDGSVDISWKAVSKADGYSIYRATSKNGKYKKIGSVSKSELSYNDATAREHIVYYYKVRAKSGKNLSPYSKAESGYVPGTIRYVESLNIYWPEADGQFLSGSDVCSNAPTYNFVISYKGQPTSEYTLYCDTSRLDVTKGKNGKLRISPKEKGYYLLTFRFGDEVGTFGIHAGKGETSNITIQWNDHDERLSNECVIIPREKRQLLKVYKNNKRIQTFHVSVSDKSVCTAKVTNGMLQVTNKSPGKCKITITYNGKKTVFDWLVKGGGKAMGVVPVSKSVGKAALEKILKKMTTPEYSRKEIENMVDSGITIEELAEKIHTPADVIQLLYSIDYKKIYVQDNVGLGWPNSAGINWGFIWSAPKAYENRSGNCGGTSVLFNYLLQGDYDEQGYVEYSNSEGGGHIFNYFKMDDVYVMCDFVGLFGRVESPADTRKYIVYIARSTDEFSKYYVENDIAFSIPDDLGGLAAVLYMYKREGDKLPKGEKGEGYGYILPAQYKDDYVILYERPGYRVAWEHFDETLWPKEIYA